MAQVPIATLRYYDQVGLLKPVSVDRSSGYRYYSFNQLPRLNRILALKGMGFSLDNIADLLKEELSVEQMRGMLRMRQVQLNQQLAELQGQLREVENRVHQIEREDQKPHYDVILKQTEPQLVASVRAILPTHGAVSELFHEVYCSLGEHVGAALGPNPGQNGQSLVLWYDTEYKETDFDGAAAFFLRCPAPESGQMRVHELPACLMATTFTTARTTGLARLTKRWWPGLRLTITVSPGPTARLTSTIPCLSTLTTRPISPKFNTRSKRPFSKVKNRQN